LIKNGFMANYVVWTEHGERGVVMEDNEEEVDNILDWAATTGNPVFAVRQNLCRAFYFGRTAKSSFAVCLL
jgi:hypothetical protein